MLTLRPKVAIKSAIIIGFNSGDAKRNVKVGPKPALAFSNPRNMGMVEQLQNGVIAPSSAAKIYPLPCELPKIDCNLESGIYCCSKLTAADMIKKSTDNSTPRKINIPIASINIE